jgi:hypothetical protein
MLRRIGTEMQHTWGMLWLLPRTIVCAANGL